jgi:hypothetical protein
LIVVPSILDILGIEGIKPFLKKQFTERGIPIPTGFDEKHVDLSDVYCPNRLRELQAIATQRRGKLLSVKYLVVLGRNNPSLYTVKGRPLYVHLNGLAIVLLK